MATRPTQLRIPPDLLVQIDQAAKDEGVTRTAWLLDAARAKLPKPLAHEVHEPAGVPYSPDVPEYRCPRHPEFVRRAATAQCWCNRKVVPVA